jgi:signal transduction histidine kinase
MDSKNFTNFMQLPPRAYTIAQHFQKLSIKIGASTAIIAWISIEIVVRLVLMQSLNDTREALQQTLCNMTGVAARALNGDDHELACSGLPGADSAFQRLRTQMQELRKASSFKEQWYTFLPSATDTVRFGVMTHSQPFSGEPHILGDTSVLRVYRAALYQKQAGVTGIYTDDKGTWISGFAPILNSKGQTVAVLELDHTYSEYLAHERAIRSDLVPVRLVGFFIGGVLGMLMGWLVAKPVEMVSEAVNNIAGNDFQGNVEMPVSLRIFPDETATLIRNVNKMSAKLEDTVESLRRANERLQSLDHAKSVFLSFVAHELRTPLTPLYMLRTSAAGGMMSDSGTLTPEFREALNHASLSVERLRSLSLAAEQYVAALTHTPQISEQWSLTELVPMLVEDFVASLEHTAISFEYIPPVNNEALVVSIPYKVLFIILAELFDNAAKFGASGERVVVRLWREGERAYCSVQDFGSGFDQHLQSRLFEPFFVGDIHHHRQGAGVNLATARVYAQHYHGDISATSLGKEKGCTFTAMFQLAR